MIDPLTILYEQIKNPQVDYKGDLRWYNEKGERHRLDGPAFISKDGKREEWYVNGEKHREDGPAVEYLDANYREWWIRGKLHREDGPAVMTDNGRDSYYLNHHLKAKSEWLKDARVQRALKIKELENKDIKDDDFLRKFGEVI